MNATDYLMFNVVFIGNNFSFVSSMFIAEVIEMNLLHILNLELTKLKLLPIKSTLNNQLHSFLMALSAESFLMITFLHRPTTASKKLFPSKKKTNMPCCLKRKSAEGDIHVNSVCCSVKLVQARYLASHLGCKVINVWGQALS